MTKKINIKNRFLPQNESVAKGLEPETRIQDFNIKKELGSGAFGRVYLVEHKITKVSYAIKAIDKRNKSNLEQKPYFCREIEIMYKLHHPNIVKLYGHFEDNNYCYFLMEYIPKGNLYSLMPRDKKKRLNQKIVVSIMKDIISAVYYLHNMEPPIIHRDIKPENILLGDNLLAKITDFGWSNYIVDGIKRTTMCGTPIYLAPEIIKEKEHNGKVDIWCIGILLFELTTGTLPFKGNDLETLKKNILSLNISWPKEINNETKTLISKILKLEPNERISLEEIIQHNFFTKYFDNPLQYLVKPNKNMIYQPFLISKDIPTQINFSDIFKNNISENEELSLKKKYMEILNKYEKLKNDYDEILKNNESFLNELNVLKNILNQKEEKIAELLESIKKENENRGEGEGEGDMDESYLKIRYDELEKNNLDYKNKIKRYEEFLNENKIENDNNIFDRKLKSLRNSIENNKETFDEEINNLQNHLDKEAKINFNEIIKEKDREIEKIKEEMKIRRNKEKKKMTTIANKYDNQLTLLEKENERLKKRFQELQKK